MKNHEFFSVAQDFIALMLKGNIKDFTRKGHCSGCGECCSNTLPISASEVEHIKSYVREHNIQPQFHSKRLDVIDALCPFLNAHRRCLIYEVRPLICKAFKCNLKASSEKFIKIFLREHRPCVDVRHTFFQNEVSA